MTSQPTATVKPATAPAAPASVVKPATTATTGATTAPETKPTAKPAKPEVTVDMIGGAFMMPAALAETSAPVRARSDKQRAMDTKVGELHKLWISKGRPSATWDKLTGAGVVATYFMSPELSEGLKTLVNRSCTFLGVRARWGTPFVVTEALLRQFPQIPAEKLGNEVISFAILDKRERATNGQGKPAAAVVAETKPATK